MNYRRGFLIFVILVLISCDCIARFCDIGSVLLRPHRHLINVMRYTIKY